MKLKTFEPYASYRRDIANFLRHMRRDGKASLAAHYVKRMKDAERQLVDMILEGRLS